MMLKKVKEKLSNLNSLSVGSFLVWLGVAMTFLSMSVGAFYNLDPISASICFSVLLTILGVLVIATC